MICLSILGSFKFYGICWYDVMVVFGEDFEWNVEFV